MLGNHFALSTTFITFAVMVCGLNWTMDNEVIAYLTATLLFVCLCVGASWASAFFPGISALRTYYSPAISSFPSC